MPKPRNHRPVFPRESMPWAREVDKLLDEVFTLLGANRSSTIAASRKATATLARVQRQAGDAPEGLSDAQFSHTPDLTVVAGTQRLYNRSGAPREIRSVSASVGVPPTGAPVVVDVNLDGTTIFTDQSARPQIAALANEGVSGTPAVTTWPDGSFVTVDIDEIGTTAAGAALTVLVVYAQG